MNKTFKFSYLLGLVLLCCKDNDFKKGNFNDYNPNDFYPDRGVVYRIDTYFSFRYLSKSRDIYYIYNMSKGDTLSDVLENTTLFGLYKGDVIEVLVLKDDPRINFYNGRGFREPSKNKVNE